MAPFRDNLLQEKYREKNGNFDRWRSRSKSTNFHRIFRFLLKLYDICSTFTKIPQKLIDVTKKIVKLVEVVDLVCHGLLKRHLGRMQKIANSNQNSK